MNTVQQTDKGAAARNVVLFICDQMQQQRLGEGPGAAYTPHLDALAKEGANFSNCFASNPQCTPSRTSLQTGLYPHEAGVMTNYGFFGHTAHLGADADTIGHAFTRAGYRTAYFGKSHLGYPLDALGYQCFEDHGGVEGALAGVDHHIARDANQFLAEQDGTSPYFLTVSFHEPHPPFELVDEFADRYPGPLPKPASFEADLADKPAFHRERQASDEGRMDPEVYDEELRRYLTMISHMDSMLGSVCDAIRQRGDWDNTVIVFTSDHGDMMGAHGIRLKGTFAYDELLRVPLIIKGCERPDRIAIDDLVSNVQIPGTLLDLAGVAKDEVWATRPTMQDVMQTPIAYADQRVFAEHYAAYWGVHPLRVIRTRDWKYVEYYDAENEQELYNLQDDPHEMNNLSADPASAPVLADMRRQLEQWWTSTDGRDAEYYASTEYRTSGASDLLDDNVKWAMT